MKEKFNISRNIFDQLVRKTWVPKFEKHQCLRTLIVDRIKNEKCIVKSVSTIPDECKGVGLEMSTNPKRKAIVRWII